MQGDRLRRHGQRVWLLRREADQDGRNAGLELPRGAPRRRERFSERGRRPRASRCQTARERSPTVGMRRTHALALPPHDPARASSSTRSAVPGPQASRPCTGASGSSESNATGQYVRIARAQVAHGTEKAGGRSREQGGMTALGLTLLSRSWAWVCLNGLTVAGLHRSMAHGSDDDDLGVRDRGCDRRGVRVPADAGCGGRRIGELRRVRRKTTAPGRGPRAADDLAAVDARRRRDHRRPASTVVGDVMRQGRP